MGIVAKLDDMGRAAWLALTVLAFILWWPIGLATLVFTIGSGRMAGCRSMATGRWYNLAERTEERASRWMNRGGFGSSGNRAFDEYREETLRRLEEEQRAFKTFLERLRQAKDKAEFDAFMAERRRREVDASETGQA